ncbi:hypothetical protein AVEN_233197-1 [Araneus ventricosus]|uniref:DDE-1 domain-containing protein n=1 Tax=Araneus ventricosus TaxID=182803 RepID=A0A4Y2BFZ0_ARAVE|nr:hypothetical protein AVEN_233197-1 [Araneus ventricosus]
MDQNVIQNIKLGYLKLLLTSILNDPARNENLEKTLKNVNLRDVAFSLANCWASVSTLLINKSWKNLLFQFTMPQNIRLPSPGISKLQQCHLNYSG